MKGITVLSLAFMAAVFSHGTAAVAASAVPDGAGTGISAKDTSADDLFSRKVETNFAYRIFLMIPEDLTYKGIESLDDRNGEYQDLDERHNLKNPLHLGKKTFCGSMMELINIHCYPMSNGDYKIYYARFADDNDHSDESVDNYAYSASDILVFVYHEGRLEKRNFDLDKAGEYRFGDRHMELDGTKYSWNGENFARQPEKNACRAERNLTGNCRGNRKSSANSCTGNKH